MTLDCEDRELLQAWRAVMRAVPSIALDCRVLSHAWLALRRRVR